MTDPQSPSPDSTVSLRAVTKDNLRDILRLKVAEAQERFVNFRPHPFAFARGNYNTVIHGWLLHLQY